MNTGTIVRGGYSPVIKLIIIIIIGGKCYEKKLTQNACDQIVGKLSVLSSGSPPISCTCNSYINWALVYISYTENMHCMCFHCVIGYIGAAILWRTRVIFN